MIQACITIKSSFGNISVNFTAVDEAGLQRLIQEKIKHTKGAYGFGIQSKIYHFGR